MIDTTFGAPLRPQFGLSSGALEAASSFCSLNHKVADGAAEIADRDLDAMQAAVQFRLPRRCPQMFRQGARNLSGIVINSGEHGQGSRDAGLGVRRRRRGRNRGGRRHGDGGQRLCRHNSDGVRLRRSSTSVEVASFAVVPLLQG